RRVPRPVFLDHRVTVKGVGHENARACNYRVVRCAGRCQRSRHVREGPASGARRRQGSDRQGADWQGTARQGPRRYAGLIVSVLGRAGQSVRVEYGARGEHSARSGVSLLSGSTTLGSRRGARERGFTVMQTSRNTVAGVSLLAGIAICSLASFADVTAARAQDNNAAVL